ncbi:MAG: hypothetical protein BWY09_02421 [Candidatus Hydrogenedentes bacterium ADurb.Bin179]|nr:MAG: hypothetical protein BWY09_02421 [Candidatus Hydrogenedentes bacterium ADurb.Bin179]
MRFLSPVGSGKKGKYTTGAEENKNPGLPQLPIWTRNNDGAYLLSLPLEPEDTPDIFEMKPSLHLSESHSLITSNPSDNQQPPEDPVV